MLSNLCIVLNTVMLYSIVTSHTLLMNGHDETITIMLSLILNGYDVSITLANFIVMWTECCTAVLNMVVCQCMEHVAWHLPMHWICCMTKLSNIFKYNKEIRPSCIIWNWCTHKVNFISLNFGRTTKFYYTDMFLTRFLFLAIAIRVHTQ